MKVIVIPADAPARIEDVAITLDWLQTTCGEPGGYVETIPAPGAVLWFSAEGKRLGRARNATATAFLRDAGAFPGDYIAGTAILTGVADEEGEVTAVPPAWERIVVKEADHG